MRSIVGRLRRDDRGGCAERGIVQDIQILVDGAARRTRRQAVRSRPAALAIGVGADQAGIDREALAADQPFGHAAAHRRLEHLAQQIAVAEAAVSVPGEGRVIRHRAIEAQPAEPAVRQVEVDLIAQSPLGADAETVADDQHADHQFWIDRGPARRTVVGLQVLPDAGQIDEPVDRTQHVIRRYMPLQAEAVEQRLLHHRPLAHHRPNPPLPRRE